MRTFALPLTILGTILVPLFDAAPAQALNNKSWVSSTGSGSTCTRALPCGNFQTAHDQTNAGGEIGVVDSGDYGLLVISKAISIIAEGVDATVISAGAGSAAITFSSSTPPTDVVTLQGLIIDGLGTGGIGISWPYGPALVVKNCVIRNFKNAGAGWGIAAQVAVSGQLSVSDTLIVNNGGSLAGAGIAIKLQPGGSANVSINRTELRSNVNGIFADGSAGGGGVNLNVRDSVVTGSSNSGIIVFAPTAPMAALIDRTTVNYSLNTGVAASGSATVRIGNSTISNNVTGVAAFNNAIIRSYKNNQINANSTDGTPITAEGLN